GRPVERPSRGRGVAPGRTKLQRRVVPFVLSDEAWDWTTAVRANAECALALSRSGKRCGAQPVRASASGSAVVSTIQSPGTNASTLPHYLLNEAAVTHARRLIDAHQYVLDS